jgi:hypothetical protein
MGVESSCWPTPLSVSSPSGSSGASARLPAAPPATEEEKLLLGLRRMKNYTIFERSAAVSAANGIFRTDRRLEIMDVSAGLKHVISTRGSPSRSGRPRSGRHENLRMSAAEYVLDGTTSIQEMVKSRLRNNGAEQKHEDVS